MLETRSSNNLPMGLVVNRTMVTPTKSKQIPVILVNTNPYSVWIWQSLLATDIVETNHCPWDYQSTLSHEGDEIKVSFHLVPTFEVQEEIFLASVSNSQTTSTSNLKEQSERSTFGPRPKFNSPDFYFQKELQRLPFPINLGEVELSRSQQVRFLELIYDNQGVFSLCNEDLDLCDCLKHTIPTTKDKPIYLMHSTIPVQLQAEFCKCLDAWLQQGIIRPL